MKKAVVIALGGILALSTSNTQAGAYKCELDGKKVYQSTPCTGSLGTVGETMEERRKQEEERRRREELNREYDRLKALDDADAKDRGFEIDRFYSITSYASRVVLKVSKPMKIRCAVLNTKGEYQTVRTFRAKPPVYEGQFMVDENVASSVKCWPD